MAAGFVSRCSHDEPAHPEVIHPSRAIDTLLGALIPSMATFRGLSPNTAWPIVGGSRLLCLYATTGWRQFTHAALHVAWCAGGDRLGLIIGGASHLTAKGGSIAYSPVVPSRPRIGRAWRVYGPSHAQQEPGGARHGAGAGLRGGGHCRLPFSRTCPLPFQEAR